MRNAALARLLAFLMTLLLFSLASRAAAPAAAAPTAVWQWSVPLIGENGAPSRAYLWIPPTCRQVRAVVVANHNMIEQGILEHPAMRRTLSDLGIAEVWVVPGLDHVFDFRAGANERFQRLMDDLAAESGYGELKTAPVIPMGHSANATYPWNFAAGNPARTLAVLSIHGDAPQTNLTGYGRANVDWGDGHAIDGISGLMVMGEYEWWEDRIAPAFAYATNHPQAPLAFLADAGHGHFDFSDRLVTFLAMFIRKASAARLPAHPAAGDGPVTLRPVDPRKGWRIDRWRKDQPPSAPAAPYGRYTGDPREAFWCFDREMAGATEAYYAAARGKKPQLIQILQEGAPLPHSEAMEDIRPRFAPTGDDLSFTLSAAFADTVAPGAKNLEKWSGLPVGAPLGHASGGGPIRFSRIVGPVVQTGPNTFAYRLGRAEYTPNRRNGDLWLLASHPGDSQYKSAVQQIMVHVAPNTTGAPQRIDFPPLTDVPAGTRQILLTATSSARLPVRFYVREGPAFLDPDGTALRFTPIPPKARFPVKVTIVAWQWGRATEPKVQTAEPVERAFLILASQK